jgi:hypothetical protein
MKRYWEWKYGSITSMSALDGSDQLHVPAALPLGKVPGTHSIGDLVGPSAATGVFINMYLQSTGSRFCRLSKQNKRFMSTESGRPERETPLTPCRISNNPLPASTNSMPSAAQRNLATPWWMIISGRREWREGSACELRPVIWDYCWIHVLRTIAQPVLWPALASI